MKLAQSFMLLLLTAARISGEDAGFVDDSFLPCPGTVEKTVNDMFSTVTSSLNDGWKAISQPLDPIDIDFPMGNLPSIEGFAAIPFAGYCSGLYRASKVDMALHLPAITGLGDLKFKELKVMSHNAGKGKSCDSDPDAGPFRCVLEGGFAADAGVEEGIKLELGLEMTVDCSTLNPWGSDKTVKETIKGSCAIAEDILDLSGTYCAGQCNNMIPIVNSMKVDEAALMLGDITCDFGDEIIGEMLEGVVNGLIETLVGDRLAVDMAGPINDFLGSTFPFPTTCAAEKKFLRST